MKPKQNSSPVAPSTRTNQRANGANGKRLSLNSEELEMAKELGLTGKEELKAFAKELAAEKAAEKAGRR